VQNLEGEVRRLENRISELERRYLNITQKDIASEMDDEEKQRQLMKAAVQQKLAMILETKQSEEDRAGELIDLIKSYAQASQDRQGRIDYYLNRVKECMTPGLQVKFAIWSLTQDKDFYSKSPGGGGGLWDSLMRKELELTEEQEQKVLAERDDLAVKRRNLLQADRELEDFRAQARKQIVELQQSLKKCGEVFTAEQLARFLVWSKKNMWCVQMMDGIYHRT